MRNILLTNIGNRNLLFKSNNVFIPYDLKVFGKSFRELTKEYLELQLYDNLRLNILDKVLAEIPDLSKIIIFASDCPPTTRNDQDTIFEAEIIKNIIKNTQQNIEVDIVVVDNVVDNNYLLKKYKEIIKNIISTYAFDTCYICDAGGTGQQKTSLKNVAEFLIDEKKTLKIVDVLQTENLKSEVKVHSNYEYRNIITYYQVESLIKKGNYEAAASLLGNANKSLKVFLVFMQFRLDLIDDRATSKLKSLLDCLPKSLNEEQKQFLSSFSFYLRKEIPQEFPLNELVSKVNAFYLYERLQAALFYLSIENYTRAIHLLAVFVEMVVSASIEHLSGGKFKLTSDYFNAGNAICKLVKETPALLEDWKEIYSKIKPESYPEEKEIEEEEEIMLITSLPLLIFFLEKHIAPKINSTTLSKTLYLVKESNSVFLKVNQKQNKENSLGLDKIRNPFAHEARGVTKETIHNLFPDFDNWCERLLELCGLTNKYENSYCQTNKRIVELFFK